MFRGDIYAQRPFNGLHSVGLPAGSYGCRIGVVSGLEYVGLCGWRVRFPKMRQTERMCWRMGAEAKIVVKYGASENSMREETGEWQEKG